MDIDETGGNALTEGERVMLAALPREMEPGDLLEERVVTELRRRGHFGRRGADRRWIRMVTGIAAAIALFAGGVVTGLYVTGSREGTPVRTVTVPDTRNETIQVSGEQVSPARELWL